MKEERINEILKKSKELINAGGNKEDIYDLLLSPTTEIVPYYRCIGSVSRGFSEEKEKQLAKYYNIDVSEIRDKDEEAQKIMYGKDFFGFVGGGYTTNILYQKFNEYRMDKGSYIRKRMSSQYSHINQIKKEFFVADYRSNGFYGCYRKGRQNYDNLPIKLYFKINPTIESFTNLFADLMDFVNENEMGVYCKCRYDDSSDMVTFRFYDTEKIDKVIEFVNKHKVESKNANPFISEYNGIGYTLDDGNSYNGFLSDEIFEYVSKNEDVNLEGFKNQINDKKKNINLEETEEKINTQALYIENFERAINNDEFDIIEFISSCDSHKNNNTDSKVKRKV